MSNETIVISDDLIAPVSIVHGCDQILCGGELEQEYNFLVYTFETGERSYSARSYLDTIHTVSIFGPYLNDGSDKALESEEIDDRILSYFFRRFSRIKRFKGGEYVTL